MAHGVEMGSAARKQCCPLSLTAHPRVRGNFTVSEPAKPGHIPALWVTAVLEDTRLPLSLFSRQKPAHLPQVPYISIHPPPHPCQACVQREQHHPGNTSTEHWPGERKALLGGFPVMKSTLLGETPGEPRPEAHCREHPHQRGARASWGGGGGNPLHLPWPCLLSPPLGTLGGWAEVKNPVFRSG